MAEILRIATFNVENLDNQADQAPSFLQRKPLLRDQLLRLRADIICFQEVHGQETPGQKRSLQALKELLDDSPYQDYSLLSTKTQNDEVYNERNLVIASKYPIIESRQIQNEMTPPPKYGYVTPPEEKDRNPRDITSERPILYAKIQAPNNQILHIINIHLKSKRPTNIPGQKVDTFTWKTASGWAEGYFVSAMKRVAQALEVRMFVDTLFKVDKKPLVVVAGDYNADFDEVPVEAIRGTVEDTQNPDLAGCELIPCEFSIPESSRFTLYHNGQGEMIDHILISRGLLAMYQGVQIHNENLKDESLAFATDAKFPQADHAPIVAEFIV